ncbi:MAG: RnfH family protein [Gammaproteobacteria bacterium]|nr:RnfH family protein [Gammaproteobacteria bacterium]MBT8109825.1 RnfH family protein [Gammaproteobacteria bacterium]NND46322.1 RnfH family protein [Woeseiaceae bacterium]NNL44527.1 RnfH family protein [Woeseiaceae bacterium]
MADIRVEVVFASAARQRLIAVTLGRGATVADAISESAIASQFPTENLDELQAGVWGKLVERDYILSDGDRVEIYRTLEMDPRQARRQLALLGRTMGQTTKD